MSTVLSTYNGWPNYPTWNVALWMDNDQGSHEYVRELAREAIDANTDVDAPTVDTDTAAYQLAQGLEAFHEEATPELEGFAADIFGWAIGFVDWRHIAQNLIEEELNG